MAQKVLVYSLYEQGFQEACQFEAANECLENNDEVLFVTCGKCMGFCNSNHIGNKARCFFCQRIQLSRAKKYLKSSAKIVSVSDYCTDQIIDFSNNYSPNFNSIEEVKKIVFHGVEIGYGALSSYLSWTRNIEVDFDGKARSFILDLLRMQVRLVLSIEAIFQEFSPDKIVIHNGRFAQFKPLLGIAVSKGIPYICTETIFAANGEVQREFFYNACPHNVANKHSMIIKFWNNYKDIEERDKIARSFYENRKNAVFAGDKIYVKDQTTGKLPSDWDTKKENIVIFNSSEDEYCAIGSDTENDALFDSQLIGIRKIVERFEDDSTKHFTLRVHPHLKGLPYRYHQDLYNLQYKNLTVIPAESDISSYSVLDAADKIIVFGSTIGIEASYWGKPVINLAYALYEFMDVVYWPKTETELWNMIDDKQLKPKPQNNALPYGLYYMTDKHEPFKYFNVGKFKVYNFLGHEANSYTHYTLFGSDYLYAMVNKFFHAIERVCPVFCRYKKMPV